MKIEIKEPARSTVEDLRDFRDMMLLGGEAMAAGLGERIARARLLAFGRRDAALVCIAGIKVPSIPYRDGAFKKSKSPLRPGVWPLELGWVFIDQSARGQGRSTALVEHLVAAVGGKPLFATSVVPNAPMHRTLRRFGFETTGHPFPSSRRVQELLLFFRTPPTGP